MGFEVQLHVVSPELQKQMDRIEAVLVDIRTILTSVANLEVKEVADLSALQADVAANTDVTQSAVTLLAGLAAQLQAAATDPAEVQAIAAQLEANSSALADAVVANTPAEPTP